MTDRLKLAARILCSMLTTAGSKHDKVSASFEYADLLLTQAARDRADAATTKRD